MDLKSPLFDPRALARLEGLRLAARQVAEGLHAGAHRGADQGVSVEFSEHREYAPGDDPRYVDWRVFGRTDKYYVKRFEDETNLTLCLLVDGSQSMTYRGSSAPWSKWRFAQCAAASLAWLALVGRDAAGLGVYDQRVVSWVEPAAHLGHIEPVLTSLESFVPERATDSAASLAEVAERLSRRSLVVLISDLLEDLEPLLRGSLLLQQQRHELAVLHLLDPDEWDFPFSEPTAFRDLETADETSFDAAAMRRLYLEEVRRHCEALQRGFDGMGVRYVRAFTTDTLDRPLRALITGQRTRVHH